MTITLHLRISGRVQGVGFRHYTQREARRRGISGWVRNRNDGTVEAVFHGAREDVERMVRWAQHGPPSATVTDVQVTRAEGEYDGFEQRPTE